jgi:hypothetical protein
MIAPSVPRPWGVWFWSFIHGPRAVAMNSFSKDMAMRLVGYWIRAGSILSGLSLILCFSAFDLAAASGASPRCDFIGPIRSVQSGDSTSLTWTTSRELGVVGFDVLQRTRDGNPFTPVNTSLIAASNSPSGAVYNLPVPASLAAAGVRIVIRVWAEDATFTDHDGKIESPQPAANSPVSASPQLISPPHRPTGHPVRSDLPAVDSVDVHTRLAGVYFLRFEELASVFQIPVEEVVRQAGLGRLALRQQGVMIPCWGDETSGGRYFYAPRIESLFFAGNVTQIRFEDSPPMASRIVPTLTDTDRTYGRNRVTLEKNLQGVPSLPGDANDDFWVWDNFLGGHPSFGVRKYAFDLLGLAVGAEPVVVEVELISASEAQHQFAIALNNHALGTEAWSGRQRRRLRFEADPAWLLAKSNSLQIVSGGDRLSLSYLDRFSLDYPRSLEPGAGPILFSATETATLESHGPAGSAVEVWDVSTSAQPIRLTQSEAPLEPDKFRFSTEPGHDYVTFLRGTASSPDRWQAFGPDWLRTFRPGAEYLAIAPDSLAVAATGLTNRRQAQGLSTLVVSLGTIQHEFGFGLSSPAALARFLEYTHVHWGSPPHYVVLVGDGTYDYQAHLGLSDNLVPPLLTTTSFGRAVSDVLFADVDHDGRPDLAIGRLPVHSDTELLRLIGQMDDFGARVVSTPQALLLADRPDEAGGFISNVEQLQPLLADSFGVTTILNDTLEDEAVRQLLFQRLASGVSVFNYVGHGGRDRLGSGYLTAAEAGSVNFGSQQPFVVAMTCAAGQFGLPGTSSLGEALLLKSGRAPIAVWSPSGFSIDFQAHQLNLLLADELTQQPRFTRLGDVLKRVITAYRNQNGDPVSPAIYNLLGDPALPLNFGDPPLRLTVMVNEASLHINLAGVPGRTYRVESSNQLDGTGWDLVREIVSDANGGGEFLQALSGDSTSRYFRAVSHR